MSPDTGLNPVISQLRDHLAFRRMECGMSALAAHSAALHALDPAEPNAGMARACIWQGLTLAAEPDADLEAARRSCQQAIALLQPEGVEGQRGWDDLETLKNRVLQTRPIDPLLRAWSNGAVENKTFLQMTEEFVPHRDSQGLGAGRPQSSARCQEAFHFTQEGAQDFTFCRSQ